MVVYSFSNIFSCIKNEGVIFQETEGQNKRLLVYFCVMVQQFEEVLLYSSNYSSSRWTQVIIKSLIFLRILMSGCYLTLQASFIPDRPNKIRWKETFCTTTQKKVVMGLLLWMHSWAEKCTILQRDGRHLQE